MIYVKGSRGMKMEEVVNSELQKNKYLMLYKLAEYINTKFQSSGI